MTPEDISFIVDDMKPEASAGPNGVVVSSNDTYLVLYAVFGIEYASRHIKLYFVVMLNLENT